MSECPESDIINGATTIETAFWGVHPRLYLTRDQIMDLKANLDREPWAGHWARLRESAVDGRLPHAALAWLLSDDSAFRDAALEKLEAMAQGDNPGQWLSLHNLAMGYDWLYDELTPELRTAIQARLNREAREMYHKVARHETYTAGTYGWNIALHEFLQIAVPAFAIYGDVPDVSPWLRFVSEKMRAITAALGPDGVSPEGICYGGFFTDSYIRVATLVRDLLGWNPFEDNAHMRNLPYFYLYSNPPLNHLAHGQAHLHFGDSVRTNWYGPDYFLRLLAAETSDPAAQWIAHTQSREGLSANEGVYFNLLWHDPSVPAELPPDLPPDRHFSDKDLVVLRSGWHGDESVFAMLCGPHAGHHALRHYPQCIGGGHMSPAAGNLQLFAHGDWLLNHGAYCFKRTEYHNAVTINERGQTGEGQEWFECLQLRREQRAPAITRFISKPDWAIVSANLAPAYDAGLGLKKYFRHVVYLRPDCWVLIDDLAAEEPATFDVWLHSWEKAFETDRPFECVAERTWETGGTSGRLRIESLAPTALGGGAGIQFQKGVGVHHRDRDMCILRLNNAKPARRARFVTLMEAFATGSAPLVQGHWDGAILNLTYNGRKHQFALRGQNIRHMETL